SGASGGRGIPQRRLEVGQKYPSPGPSPKRGGENDLGFPPLPASGRGRGGVLEWRSEAPSHMTPRHPFLGPALPGSRRTMLKSLASGFGYLAFAGLAHEAAARSPGALAPKPTHFPARAKRVIFLCM